MLIIAQNFVGTAYFCRESLPALSKQKTNEPAYVNIVPTSLYTIPYIEPLFQPIALLSLE